MLDPSGTVFASGLTGPYGLAFDTSGNLYSSNLNNNSISKITPNGSVNSFVNSGLNSPRSLAFDASGNLYCANFSGGFTNGSISKITTNGSVSNYLNIPRPIAIAFDTLGNLYCCLYINNQILKIETNGSYSLFVNSGLDFPNGLAFDTSGNLYCANYISNTISQITPNGNVTTFVNSGLSNPVGLAFDTSGNLYCSNPGNNTISKITPNGSVSTFVDGLNNPRGLVFDTLGNLYCANFGENNIIKFTKPPPTITNFSIPSKTFGEGPFNIVDPSSNSTGSFSYTSSNTSVATISGNTITIVGAGTSTITATQAATSNYASGDISANFVVNQATPTITNFYIPTKTFGEGPFNIVDPSSNSTGAFSYTSSNTSVATISGNTITIVGAGTSTITANQDASGNYTSGDISANFIVTNPVVIEDGNELLYFMSTTSKYGDITSSVQIDSDLLALTEKVLFTTSDNVSITKID